VDLLAADQLGATRDGISTAGDLRAYRRAMFSWAIGEARRRGCSAQKEKARCG
jgi:hypothetical protein